MKTLSPLAWLAIGIVRLYRLTLSPLFPGVCRFEPTCSQYALDAIGAHGALRGGWLALRRILRCHPVKILGGRSGFDPVPPHGQHRHGSH